MGDKANICQSPLDKMIDLRHTLAVLASRMPWTGIDASVESFQCAFLSSSLASVTWGFLGSFALLGAGLGAVLRAGALT